MTLAQLKRYLRVDGIDSDGDLTMMLSAAEFYIYGQTGKSKVVVDDVEYAINTDEVHNMAVKMICAHWFENRGIEIAGTLTKITHSADAIIKHISLREDYI